MGLLLDMMPVMAYADFNASMSKYHLFDVSA